MVGSEAEEKKIKLTLLYQYKRLARKSFLENLKEFSFMHLDA